MFFHVVIALIGIKCKQNIRTNEIQIRYLAKSKMYLRMVIIEASYVIDYLEEPQRFVDAAIGRFVGFETKNAVKKGIKRQRFLLNGTIPETGSWVNNGDQIDLLVAAQIPKAYHFSIEIVFEDPHLAVVMKPAGMVVSGNQFKTLEHCMIDQLSKSSEPDALSWALPVHRLDAATSGLVLFAKTNTSRRLLGQLFENKKIEKVYHALVHGRLESMRVETPVDGKPAASRIEWIAAAPSLKNGELSLVKLFPETGRTHQLRIHCASVGSPIVGDKLYRGEQGTFTHKGLFLAATKLKFNHPITGELVEIEVPVPAKFDAMMRREQARWETKLSSL